MTRAMLTSLLLVASVAVAHQEDARIETQADLLDWCQAESEARLIGKGVTPYNWSASYWEEVNTFFVKGSWRVDDGEVSVECRVARGAQRRYAAVLMRPQK